MSGTTFVAPRARWDEPVCACMCFTKSEENEWGVKEITLQFLQGIRRNQASTDWTRSPEGSFLYLFFSLSLTVIPAPPPPAEAHTQRHIHATHTAK